MEDTRRTAGRLAWIVVAATLAGCPAAAGRAGARGDGVAREAAGAPGEAGPEAEAGAYDGAERCERVRERREAFLARGAEGEAPHLVAVLPFALLDRLIEPEVRAVPPTRLDAAPVGLAGLTLRDLSARLRSVTVRPAPPDLVGLRIVVDVEWRGRAVLAIVADAEVRPELDREGRRLVLALGPDDLGRVEPRVDDRAADGLAAALRSMLPAPVRPLISASAARSAGEALLPRLLESAWPAVRAELAGRAGSLGRLELPLPDVPVESLGVRSEAEAGGRLVAELRLALPVRDPGPAPAGLGDGLGDDALALFAPDATLAELGNWAMETGRIPSRFDDRGQADPEGPFEARLDWQAGPRPLVAHVWRVEGRCLRARLGAGAEARVEGDRVFATLSDTRVDEVDGPLEARLAGLASSLWTGALERPAEMASTFRFEAGGEERSATLLEAARVEGGFAARLRLDPAGAP